MRKIGGINSSHGKRDGQAALGVRKVMWSIFHIAKSEASDHTWLAIRVEPGPTCATPSPTE
jgi:hypothetical protein